MTFQLRTKPRPPSQAATLTAVDSIWRTAREIATRAPDFSPKTVRNNLDILVEERAVETRVRPYATAPYEYRLPEGSA